MNVSRKGLQIAINSLAFGGSALWVFFQPGYESIITSIVLFGSLVALLTIRPKLTTIHGNSARTTANGDSLTPKSSQSSTEDLEKRKRLTNVLFVDDDTKFKIVKILNKAGWQTKIVKDIQNLDAEIVLNSHILFIDIHGVGTSLGFKDEGLGLAYSLKRKYPLKKIIIYSTESTGDRFHEALRSVDTFLSKNAEPFEFQELIEQYSAEVVLS